MTQINSGLVKERYISKWLVKRFAGGEVNERQNKADLYMFSFIIIVIIIIIIIIIIDIYMFDSRVRSLLV